MIDKAHKFVNWAKWFKGSLWLYGVVFLAICGLVLATLFSLNYYTELGRTIGSQQSKVVKDGCALTIDGPKDTFLGLGAFFYHNALVHEYAKEGLTVFHPGEDFDFYCDK